MDFLVLLFVKGSVGCIFYRIGLGIEDFFYKILKKVNVY